MRSIALINQKGGVGKTTSTINIGAGLANAGKSVLLVDLDPQAHTTYGLGIKAHELPFTVYDLLQGKAKPEQVIIPRSKGLSVLPSSLALAAAERILVNETGRDFLLREELGSLKGFDFILVDCPPSLGILTVNALTLASEIFVVLRAEFLALQGIVGLMDLIDVVKKRLNKKLHISGVLATCIDTRQNLDKEILEKAREFFADKAFKTVIRKNIALAEAPSHGKTIFEYQPASAGAEDYGDLVKEILKRGTI